MVVYRERIYLRDPLGVVERNGVKQDRAEVYINYSNDVLVQEDESRRWLVQAATKMPGVPLHLSCLRWTACLTETNPAPVIKLGGADYTPQVVFSGTQVEFEDGNGAMVRVAIR
jgi:hypothetical protein